MIALVIVGCVIAVYGAIQLIKHGRRDKSLEHLRKQERARAAMDRINPSARR